VPTHGLRDQGPAEVRLQADGNEEIYEAGDAYYAAPGHVPTLYAGTDVVEFSPTAELQKTIEVVSKNMGAGVGA
jgi:hypothetical protein